MTGVAGILKSRWYPMNLKTGSVYVGRYRGDQRYGFPTNTLVFREWGGTHVTGAKGDIVMSLLRRGEVKLVARSLYRR